MRVLHICINDPDYPTGGLGVAVKGIIEAQKKIGVIPYVLCFDDNHPEGRREGNILTVNIEGDTPRFADMSYHRLIWQRMATHLCHYWKNEPIDIIHLHDSWLWPVAEIAKALYNCEIVYTNHLSFAVENMGWPKWNKVSSEEAHLEIKCLTQAYNTYVSLPYAQKIIAQYHLDELMPDRPAAVIHNGVSPLDESEQVRLTGKNVYFCGRAVPTKGIKLVVEAAERLPDYSFHVFAAVSNDHKGFAETGRYLESADILLENLRWHNVHTQAQKCAYLRACDIALVPSINAAPFEITGLEAMLAGTPLITTAMCGMRDYCTDDNCTIIEPSTDALVAAIKGHVRDPDKLRGAYETASRFTWDAAAIKYKQFYERVYGINLSVRHAA